MDPAPTDLMPPITLDHGFDVTDEQLALIKPDLEPGERLLWVAWSEPKWMSTGGWWKGMLFTMSLWLISGVTLVLAGLPDFRPVEGLCLGIGVIVLSISALVLAGTLNFAFEHWKDGRQTRGMLYALTNRRAILRIPQKNSRGLVVCSLSRNDIQGMHRIEYPDGSGDLFFQLKDSTTWIYSANLAHPSGFHGVSHVRQVESLARPVLLPPDSQGGTLSNPESQPSILGSNLREIRS